MEMETQAGTPSSSVASRVVVLCLRILSFILLLIALIITAVNKDTEATDYGDSQFEFHHVYAFRYMISTIVIGMAYDLLQTAFSIVHVVTGNRILSGNGGYMLDFYCDKIISYLLATGTAAGFGASVDLRRVFEETITPFHDFFAKANASASLLLIAFLCSSALSVFSSFALPKKV